MCVWCILIRETLVDICVAIQVLPVSTKKFTLGDDAACCTMCGARCHHSYGVRAKPDAIRVYNAFVVVLVLMNPQVHQGVNDIDDDADFNNLESNLKKLYKLLSKIIDELVCTFHSSIMTIKN